MTGMKFPQNMFAHRASWISERLHLQREMASTADYPSRTLPARSGTVRLAYVREDRAGLGTDRKLECSVLAPRRRGTRPEAEVRKAVGLYEEPGWDEDLNTCATCVTGTGTGTIVSLGPALMRGRTWTDDAAGY